MNLYFIIDKYFGWSEGNEICENNIAYTNKTCGEVSSKMRKNMLWVRRSYVENISRLKARHLM